MLQHEMASYVWRDVTRHTYINRNRLVNKPVSSFCVFGVES